jgi:hypothetical protein
MEGHVNVYIHPYELTTEDMLSDGDEGEQIKITEDTLLLWVDLHPELRFGPHDTLYILISSAGTRVEQGGWWPVLNGRRILYGSRNEVAVLSPFELTRPHEDS